MGKLVRIAVPQPVRGSEESSDSIIIEIDGASKFRESGLYFAKSCSYHLTLPAMFLPALSFGLAHSLSYTWDVVEFYGEGKEGLGNLRKWLVLNLAGHSRCQRFFSADLAKPWRASVLIGRCLRDHLVFRRLRGMDRLGFAA